MGIPAGTSYPKMVTGTDTGGRLVPLVYPEGDAKQFTIVTFANATEEAAYTSNGVTITSVVGGSTNIWGNGWTTSKQSGKKGPS